MQTVFYNNSDLFSLRMKDWKFGNTLITEYEPSGSSGKELGNVGGVEILIHSFVSRLVLGSTHPPIKRVPGNFPGGKGGRA